MLLQDVFAAAADGKLPPPDGQIEVHTGLPGKTAAVIAFPAHFYVLAPVAPEWVRAQLPPGDYSAPLGARFLVALADRIGAHIGANDAVLAARAHGYDGGLDLRQITGGTHPRVRRAHRYREDVRVWQTSDGAGYLVLGRGLAGRWEVSYEVEPAARGRGLGRALAAGYQPIGGEVLLPGHGG